MPRQPRVDIPGLVYHVITRSVVGRELFRDRRDYGDFFGRLGQLVEESGTQVYAWCLMSNHLHLLLRPTERPLAWVMRRLLTGYAVAHNLRHGLSGHLFGGRYESLVVEEEAYFLELVRYIHLNPVRAGVIREPSTLDGYPLTGHCEILAPGAHPWQDVAGLLECFSADPEQALRLYRCFIVAGFDQGMVEKYTSRPSVLGHEAGPRRSGILGSREFAERILKETTPPSTHSDLAAIDEILGEVAAAHGITVSRMLGRSRERTVAQARREFLLRALEEAGASCAQLARLTGRDHSAVLRAVAKARRDKQG